MCKLCLLSDLSSKVPEDTTIYLSITVTSSSFQHKVHSSYGDKDDVSSNEALPCILQTTSHYFPIRFSCQHAVGGVFRWLSSCSRLLYRFLLCSCHSFLYALVLEMQRHFESIPESSPRRHWRLPRRRVC